MTNRQSTHSYDCWRWGPAHYECAVRQVEQLASELQEWRNRAQDKTRLWRQAMDERDAAQAEARGLRAELARVRGNRTEAELRQLKHDLETAGISAFMSPEKLPKEEWYSSAAFCRDVVRRARYVVEDMIAALSQPAERESLPLMTRDTCKNCGGTGVGGYHVHAPQEDAVEALRCEACDGFGFIEHGPKDYPATAPELPLMARRPRHNDDDLGELYENGKRLCTISGEPPLGEPMPGFVLYRIADTDEHGLPVIERTEDMPEDVTHMTLHTRRFFRAGELQARSVEGDEGLVRIEDFNEHAQHG